MTALSPGSHTFTATAEKGDVSALLLQPLEMNALLVFAHGAGASIEHQHMQSLAEAFAGVGVGTLRFNFPYMQAGGSRTDSKAVCVETFGAAIALANSVAPAVPMLVGGHSFGGRMSSHYVSEHAGDNINGLVYCSFPLHPAGKPGVSRADHMYAFPQPQLFLSGTRDALAEATLLGGVIDKLERAQVHWLDTADHSYKILKRSRQATVDVYTEAADALDGWLRETGIR